MSRSTMYASTVKVFKANFSLDDLMHRRPWRVPPDAMIVGINGINREANAKFRKLAGMSGKNKSWLIDIFMKAAAPACFRHNKKPKTRQYVKNKINICVRISRSNHIRFKAACANSGISIGDAINSFIQDFNKMASYR